MLLPPRCSSTGWIYPKLAGKPCFILGPRSLGLRILSLSPLLCMSGKKKKTKVAVAAAATPALHRKEEETPDSSHSVWWSGGSSRPSDRGRGHGGQKGHSGGTQKDTHSHGSHILIIR